VVLVVLSHIVPAAFLALFYRVGDVWRWCCMQRLDKHHCFSPNAHADWRPRRRQVLLLYRACMLLQLPTALLACESGQKAHFTGAEVHLLVYKTLSNHHNSPTRQPNRLHKPQSPGAGQS